MSYYQEEKKVIKLNDSGIVKDLVDYFSRGPEDIPEGFVKEKNIKNFRVIDINENGEFVGIWELEKEIVIPAGFKSGMMNLTSPMNSQVNFGWGIFKNLKNFHDRFHSLMGSAEDQDLSPVIKFLSNLWYSSTWVIGIPDMKEEVKVIFSVNRRLMFDYADEVVDVSCGWRKFIYELWINNDSDLATNIKSFGTCSPYSFNSKVYQPYGLQCQPEDDCKFSFAIDQAVSNGRIFNKDYRIVYMVDGIERKEVPQFLSGLLTPPRKIDDESNEDGKNDDQKMVEHQIGENLKSPFVPNGFCEIDQNCRYKFMIVSNQGKRLVFNWFEEGMFSELLGNVEKWWDLFCIEYQNKPQRHIDLFSIAKSVTFSPSIKDGVRKSEDPKVEGFVKELLYAAVRGTEMPYGILSGSIRRFGVLEVCSPGGYYQSVLERVIFAFLKRNFRMEDYPMSLDVNRKDIGYLLGRVMALIERTQRAAQGSNLNKNVIDRFFHGMLKNPVSVLPEAYSLFTSHVGKMGGGLGHYYDQMMIEVWGCIDQIPSSLSDVQKCEFIMGYNHQKYYKKQEAEQVQDQVQETNDMENENE